VPPSGFLLNLAKNFHHIPLINDLRPLLHGERKDDLNLTCANDNDEEIPCPKGCCGLNSNGKSGFSQQCYDPKSFSDCDAYIGIESNNVGNTKLESTFGYTCNKPMCNSIGSAKKVRDLLNQECLLTPTGVGSKPCGSGGGDGSGGGGGSGSGVSGLLSSQTWIIIQGILLLGIALLK
jgi:hypothetical protein